MFSVTPKQAKIVHIRLMGFGQLAPAFDREAHDGRRHTDDAQRVGHFHAESLEGFLRDGVQELLLLRKFGILRSTPHPHPQWERGPADPDPRDAGATPSPVGAERERTGLCRSTLASSQSAPSTNHRRIRGTNRASRTAEPLLCITLTRAFQAGSAATRSASRCGMTRISWRVPGHGGGVGVRTGAAASRSSSLIFAFSLEARACRAASSCS